jgi:predicted nucleic acid-binding protein
VAWAILDTSVYIDHWERGLHEPALSEVRRAFIVRHSSIVLSELRRGARTRQAQRLVSALFRLARIHWAPTGEDWWEAGRLIRKIGDESGWDARKRQEFQNDALIALTARRHGATVVTTNQNDFRRLARELRISILPI